MPAKKSNPDFDREIPGYAKMTPAERMKARTKLLLSRSAKQASTLPGTPVCPRRPPGSHSSVRIVCLSLSLCYRT